MSSNPKRILCFSGKRKTGKDYITEILQKLLNDSVIIRISAPIKKHWAESKDLNYEQLLSDGAYKEIYRAQMIAWSEEQRARDPGCFCEAAVKDFNGATYSIWLVSDLRRTTDLKFFREKFKDRVTTIRISASESVRKDRGYCFTVGIDDSESECGLDLVEDWDLTIQNNGNSVDLNGDLQKLVDICKASL
nr:EOG090X0FYC [Polyphemus pediculus]